MSFSGRRRPSPRPPNSPSPRPGRPRPAERPTGWPTPPASSQPSHRADEARGAPGGIGERLQKVLARAGEASRRQAEVLITEGRVRVNGAVVRTLGTRVAPRDRVEVDGVALRAEPRAAILLHKPAGYITSHADPQGRPVVMSLLPRSGLPRLFPVGRLDWDSEGLLLLTNDGELANFLTHPRHSIPKTYHVKVKGQPGMETLRRLTHGVVSDGERLWATEVQPLSLTRENAWVVITIAQGRHRQVRRMCEAIGHPVVKLVRVRLGPLQLGDLPRGQWRHLTPGEWRALEELRRRVGPERP